MRALVVEDEPLGSGALVVALRRQGWTVDVARIWSPRGGWPPRSVSTCSWWTYTCPDGDRIDFCAQLRTGGDRTPLLVLTPQSAVVDRVHGLDSGADDTSRSRSAPRSCSPGCRP